MVSDERPLSLNPLVGATDPSVRDLGALLYRRLLRLDDRAVPVGRPGRARTRVSQDGLTYHLPLRSGPGMVRRAPITVADVLATVAWVQSPRLRRRGHRGAAGATSTCAPSVTA